MKDIRNPDGRLICRIDDNSSTIEILEKGWVTLIQLKGDGFYINHYRKSKLKAPHD